MSSNIPLRTIRIPALRNQCFHQRRRHAQSARAFSTTGPQAFALSSPRLRGGSSLGQDRAITRAVTRTMIGPSPKVNEIKAQEEGALSDDIGLLQDTVVRAPWDKLPGVWTPAFWGYMWKLIKSKGTALYSRSLYKRCIYKTGFDRFLAIDAWNRRYIKDRAMNLYIQLYVNFARGDMSPVSRFCLSPVLRSFQDRVAAREPIKMEWQLTNTPSMSIVSHRASMFGDDQPDTAYRQVVIRIVSTQKLTIKHSAVAVGMGPSVSKSVHRTRSRKSIKESHEVHTETSFPETTQPRKVVEYLVLQRRVIRGQEEDWKIWGFTQASTPAKIEDDDAYWRKTLNSQTAGA